nr:hypothetical protein [Tanacetum cinerariifolium]
MVAILEMSEHNADFHLMVDFIKASPLRYALTVKPTVYVSHIRQFWSTARIETTDVGTQILATVDGIHRTVTESSFRRNLKLQDEARISSLPDTELFENLTLMGYNISPNQKFTFQKGEGLGTPTESHHTPSPEAQSPSHTTHTSPTLPPFTTTSIPTVTPSDTPIVRQYTRRTKIAQSSVPLTVADEPASPLRDVSQGEACPTDSSFIADQDRATIDKSSTLPHDSAPRATSPAAVEGNMQQIIPELMALCTSLQRQLSELYAKFQAQEVEINKLKERVKMLEDREGVAATRSRDDAPIKGRSMNEGEAATERISDNSKEMATVLTSMDAATVLASGVVDVPTGSGSIPTASTPAEEQVPTGSDVVPTASPIDAQVARELEEQLERKDQRKAEQIARDDEIARIHAEEELQIMISGLDRNNESIVKYLSNLGWKVKDFRGMTFEEVEAKFNLIWKQMEDFIPTGSKEEAERIKMKGINLEQENAKKQNTSEEVPEKAKSPEESNILSLTGRFTIRDRGATGRSLGWEAAQPVIIDWRLCDTCGVHHVTTKDKEIFMLVEKDFPLKKALALVMICYKLQVENYSQMASDLVLKIHKIASSPSQQGD